MSPSAPRRVSNTTKAAVAAAAIGQVRRVMVAQAPKKTATAPQLPAKPRPVDPRTGRPLSDAQMAVLNANKFKAGEPSLNPSGRPKDPRKIAAASFLATMDEVNPETGRLFKVDLWMMVSKSERLADKLFDKLLANMTPEAATNFMQNFLGVQMNGGGASAGGPFEMSLLAARAQRPVIDVPTNPEPEVEDVA